MDLKLIFWLAKQLGISTPMVLSSELGIAGSHTQRLIDIIKNQGGNRFYEGSSGQYYIDTNDFDKAGIKVSFQDYQHPVYPQLYGAFVSHLSVIDLLFNCGPDSLKILTGQ